jgi:hypothetical protein
MRIVFGLAAAVALLVAVVAGATRRFERRIDDEARALLAGARGDARMVEARDLDGLPAPVRRWLEVSGTVGRLRATTVRLEQRGELRTAPDKPWMPVVAEQYFSVDPPGFVWHVDARMMGVLPIAGRDRYTGGRGEMLIKLASLVTVADGAGPQVDQGALLRFLAEIIWFPSAALSKTITWEPIDAHNARATMRHGGVSASAVFTFGADGRFAAFAADRYMGGGSGAPLEKWGGSAEAWAAIRGVDIPVRGKVTWKLAAGDFDYFRWEIADVEVNHLALYADEPRAPEEARR